MYLSNSITLSFLQLNINQMLGCKKQHQWRQKTCIPSGFRVLSTDKSDLQRPSESWVLAPIILALGWLAFQNRTSLLCHWPNDVLIIRMLRMWFTLLASFYNTFWILVQQPSIILVCVCVLSRSVMSNSFATLWTVAHQAPLSMGFFRQEYWSKLLFPSPGDFPYLGIEPVSPALAGRFFTTEPPEFLIQFIVNVYDPNIATQLQDSI